MDIVLLVMFLTEATEGAQTAQKYQSHPAAELFPLMTGEEFAKLVEDISTHGQRLPIQLLDGKILDGRNRYRACVEANITPRTENWKGDDPFAYVISMNIARRHLEKGQRAMIVTEAKRLREAEIKAEADRKRSEAAKRRDREGNRFKSQVKSPATSETSLLQGVDRAEAFRKATQGPNVTRKSLAQQADVSENTIKDAVAVQKHAPDLVEAVKAGEVKLSAATKEVKRRRTHNISPESLAPGQRLAIPPPPPDGSLLARLNKAMKTGSNLLGIADEIEALDNPDLDSNTIKALVMRLKDERAARLRLIKALEKALDRRNHDSNGD